MGKRTKKSKNLREKISHWAKISHKGAKFLLLLFFWSTFPSDFKSVKLVLTRILYAWVDPKNLALLACKNYKISHKMRLVE